MNNKPVKACITAKRAALFLLTVSTIATIAMMCLFSVSASEIRTYGDLEYIDEGKTITITGYAGEATTTTIPGSINGKTVTKIAQSAFVNNVKLKDIIIPNTVTVIEGFAFAGCSNLTGVNIPDGVTVISEFVFSDCSRLIDVGIPNSVTLISEYAFNGCDSLISVSIPNSITSIGTVAFGSCDNLTVVNMQNGVKSIGEKAFYDCSRLTDISIPDSVTSIGENAFLGCKSLSRISIPGSVAAIGERVFTQCDALMSIDVASDSSAYTSIDGVLYNKSITTLILHPQARKGSLTVPEGVSVISDYAFSGCTGLSGVSLPNSLTSIGRGAFYGCRGLPGITLPNGLTSIGHSAFYGCSSLSQIVIPKSVTGIGIRAFQKCGGLYDIYFESETPPRADYAAFEEISRGARALVPIGSTQYGQEGSSWMGLIVTPTSQSPTAPPVSIPTVILNGKELTFDVYPRIKNGRVLVPLRAIFEAVGATVDWDNIKKTATAKRDGTTVILTSGSETATINGRTVTLDQPGIVVNGRTLALLRFVGEAFGGNVRWDETSRTVYINIDL